MRPDTGNTGFSFPQSEHVAGERPLLHWLLCTAHLLRGQNRFPSLTHINSAQTDLRSLTTLLQRQNGTICLQAIPSMLLLSAQLSKDLNVPEFKVISMAALMLTTSQVLDSILFFFKFQVYKTM